MAFQKVTILGIKCVVKDEKAMMVRVNDYLATFKRTTSKAKNQSLLGSELPFVIKHFYWNLNKDTATWFDIKPNCDNEGKWYQPAHQDCAWLLHVRIDYSTWTGLGEPQEVRERKTQDFLNGLLKAIEFDTKLIMHTDDLFWRDKLSII